jgi:hypothetical protein
MRSIHLLALLVMAAAAPAAGQGIVIPIHCPGECPANDLPGTLALDSVQAWAYLKDAESTIYVDHVFRNTIGYTIDAAVFFPLPADAAIQSVYVYDPGVPAHDPAALLQYNEWSEPAEARRIAEEMIAGRPDSGLRTYAGMQLVHVPLSAIPANASRRVQIAYTQPLRAEGGAVSWRYPLSAGAAIGDLTLGMEVTTEHGFRDLGSPSHAVDVSLGIESAPCPLRMRCGTRGVPSNRVKVVRLLNGDDVRARDFELVYTPFAQGDEGAVPPGGYRHASTGSGERIRIP